MSSQKAAGSCLDYAWPKITVVTPSYNQGRYIGETIESVVNQGYPNLEYIVIDGGSSDETIDVVSRYSDRISCFVSEPDRGQSHAINKGFARATGEILCWLNSDDQLAPNALKTVALAFAVHAPDMVAGICEIYERGELTHRHLTSCPDGPLPMEDLLDLEHGWNAGQFFYQPEVFFSRELWQRAGGSVREDFYFSMDYELWCRFAFHKAKLKVLGVPLAHFRAHEAQKTSDVQGFKKELRAVREEFCNQFNVSPSPVSRPKVNWTKRLKVALVNDLGFLYGAGIAHWRIAAALDLAGHAVESFPLTRVSAGSGGEYPRLLKKIAKFKPDIVVLGNLHAVENRSVALLEALERRWPCFWVTHDFWLFSGRCAYTGSCQQYLSGCTSSCPTANEYPALPPDLIAPAWQAKREFLSYARQLCLLANSDWAAERGRDVLATIPSCSVPVQRVSLGFPVEVFGAVDRAQARVDFGISSDEFCLAFSSSSLSDSRKGGQLLREALQKLQVQGLVLLLIGRVDQTYSLEGVRTIHAGYLADQQAVARALAAADLYVAPSLEETFGQAFVEAALVGTPSVGFALSGVADAVVKNVTGVHAKEPTAQGLAECLQDVLSDPQRIGRLGEVAPLYARSLFSLESCYHSLFQAFDAMGLIDRLGMPHKISFSAQSVLTSTPVLAEHSAGSLERLQSLPGTVVRWVVVRLPQGLKDQIRGWLPVWLDRALVRLIFGRGA